MRCRLVALDLDDHFLDQCAEQLFPVARCSRGRSPDRREVGTDHAEAIAFLSREHARTLLLATCKFQLRCLECGQTLLPRALQATRHQPVVGIDGAIATLGEACCIARPLDAEPPVLERGRAIHLELLRSGQHRCDLCRLERCNDERPYRDLSNLETRGHPPLSKASSQRRTDPRTIFIAERTMGMVSQTKAR